LGLYTNKGNSTLYTGVTTDISNRIKNHVDKDSKKSFSAKYNCNKLVYTEIFDDLYSARCRERQIKNWKRVWKNELIEKNNPGWQDISKEI
jgi:putative endonuclease